MPDDPATDVLGPADASSDLRDLGVAVDRGHLLLRSPSQPDDAVLATLGRRATGPAPVTILEFTSVLCAARAGGAAAVPNALARLADLLAAASDRLRAGDRPEVWLVGLGAPQAVHTMFDLHHHWRRRIQAPVSHELRIVVQASAATVVAENQRALACARHHLACTPFAHFGAVANLRPGVLRFVAAPGIAFGSSRIAARAPHRSEAEPMALLPFASCSSTGALDFRGLLARFWMRAAALHAPGGQASDHYQRTGRPIARAGASPAGLPAATLLSR